MAFDLLTYLTNGSTDNLGALGDALQQQRNTRRNEAYNLLKQDPRAIEQKLNDITRFAKTPEEIASLIQNDPVLRELYPGSQAIIKGNELARANGYKDPVAIREDGLKLSYEDNPNNSWLGRTAVSAFRGAESMLRGVGANLLGSYGREINKIHEQNSRLPIDRIQKIKEKQKIQSNLDSQLDAINNDIGNTSNIARLSELESIRQSILEAKANPDINLTEQEQNLINNGIVDEYDNNLKKISIINQQKASFVGDTVLSAFNDSIVNDTYSYGPEIERERMEQFDRDFSLNPEEASYLNPKYLFAKMIDMGIHGAGEHGWARALGNVFPWIILAPELSLGSGIGGTALALGRFGVMGTDIYGRFEDMVGEQWEKDPQNAPNYLRAALGAVASTAADFWGSKLALDAPYHTLLRNRFIKQYQGISEDIIKKAEKSLRDAGLPVNKKNMGTAIANETGKAIKDTNTKMSEVISNLYDSTKNIVTRADKVPDVNITPIDKTLNGIRGTINNTNALAHSVGLGAQDFARASTGLAVENMMSDVSRQYGGGTDLSDVNLEQTLASGLEGFMTGGFYHPVGMGVNIGKASAQSLLKNKYADYKAVSSDRITSAQREAEEGNLNKTNLYESHANTSKTELEKAIKEAYRKQIGKKANKGLDKHVTLDKNTLQAKLKDGVEVSEDSPALAFIDKFNKQTSSLRDNLQQHLRNLNTLKDIKSNFGENKFKEILDNISFEDLDKMLSEDDVENVSQEAIKEAIKAKAQTEEMDLTEESAEVLAESIKQSEKAVEKTNEKTDELLKSLGLSTKAINVVTPKMRKLLEDYADSNYDSEKEQAIYDEINNTKNNKDNNNNILKPFFTKERLDKLDVDPDKLEFTEGGLNYINSKPKLRSRFTDYANSTIKDATKNIANNNIKKDTKDLNRIVGNSLSELKEAPSNKEELTSYVKNLANSKDFVRLSSDDEAKLDDIVKSVVDNYISAMESFQKGEMDILGKDLANSEEELNTYIKSKGEAFGKKYKAKKSATRSNVSGRDKFYLTETEEYKKSSKDLQEAQKSLVKTLNDKDAIKEDIDGKLKYLLDSIYKHYKTYEMPNLKKEQWVSISDSYSMLEKLIADPSKDVKTKEEGINNLYAHLNALTNDSVITDEINSNNAKVDTLVGKVLGKKRKVNYIRHYEDHRSLKAIRAKENQKIKNLDSTANQQRDEASQESAKKLYKDYTFLKDLPDVGSLTRFFATVIDDTHGLTKFYNECLSKIDLSQNTDTIKKEVTDYLTQNPIYISTANYNNLSIVKSHINNLAWVNREKPDVVEAYSSMVTFIDTLNSLIDQNLIKKDDRGFITNNSVISDKVNSLFTESKDKGSIIFTNYNSLANIFNTETSEFEFNKYQSRVEFAVDVYKSDSDLFKETVLDEARDTYSKVFNLQESFIESNVNIDPLLKGMFKSKDDKNYTLTEENKTLVNVIVDELSSKKDTYNFLKGSATDYNTLKAKLDSLRKTSIGQYSQILIDLFSSKTFLGLVTGIVPIKDSIIVGDTNSIPLNKVTYKTLSNVDTVDFDKYLNDIKGLLLDSSRNGEPLEAFSLFITKSLIDNGLVSYGYGVNALLSITKDLIKKESVTLFSKKPEYEQEEEKLSNIVSNIVEGIVGNSPELIHEDLIKISKENTDNIKNIITNILDKQIEQREKDLKDLEDKITNINNAKPKAILTVYKKYLKEEKERLENELKSENNPFSTLSNVDFDQIKSDLEYVSKNITWANAVLDALNNKASLEEATDIVKDMDLKEALKELPTENRESFAKKRKEWLETLEWYKHRQQFIKELKDNKERYAKEFLERIQKTISREWGNLQFNYFLGSFKKVQEDKKDASEIQEARNKVNNAFKYKGKRAYNYYTHMDPKVELEKATLSFTPESMISFIQRALDAETLNKLQTEAKEKEHTNFFKTSGYEDLESFFIGLSINDLQKGNVTLDDKTASRLGEFFYGTKGNISAIKQFSIKTTYKKEDTTKTLRSDERPAEGNIFQENQKYIKNSDKLFKDNSFSSSKRENITNTDVYDLFKRYDMLDTFADHMDDLLEYGSILIADTDKDPLDKLLALPGSRRYSKRTLEVIAGASLLSLNTLLSAEQDEEYLNSLGDNGLATRYRERGYRDLDKVAFTLGKNILRSMKIKDSNSIIERSTAIKLGSKALVMLQEAGYLKMLHVGRNATNGLVEEGFTNYGNNNSNLANTRRVVVLNNKASRVSDIIKTLKFVDEKNVTQRPLLKFFNLDYTLNTAGTLIDKFVERQTNLREDYDTAYSTTIFKNKKPYGYTSDDVTFDFDSSSKLLKVTIKNDDLKEKILPEEIRNSLKESLPENSPIEIYLDRRYLIKDDEAIVTPERILEKLAETYNPDTLLAQEYVANNYFLDDLTIEDIDAGLFNVKDTSNESLHLLREQLNLYSDDSKKSLKVVGDKLTNIKINWLNKAKAMKRDWETFKSIIGAETLTDVEEYVKAHPVINLYYNEISVRNNRAYTSAQEFNHRETKGLRHFFNKGNNEVNLSEDIQVLGAKASILFNLGVKIDKMTEDNFNKLYTSLLSLKEFQDIFNRDNLNKDSPYKDKIKLIKDRINACNAVLENNPITYEVTSKSITDAPTKDNATSSKTFSIPTNSEALTAIYNLVYTVEISEQTTSGETKINDTKNVLQAIIDRDSITNWLPAIEQDGLTNGVLIRYIQNQNTMNESSLKQAVAGGYLLNVVKATNFISARDENGGRYFDTYELTSISTRNELSYETIKSIAFGKGDNAIDTMEFISSVYGKDSSSVDNLITHTANEILTRDFSKYPTMTVSYNVGQESLLNSILGILEGSNSIKFGTSGGISHALYKASIGDTTDLRNIITSICKINGGYAYITRGNSDVLKIESDGTILSGSLKGSNLYNLSDANAINPYSNMNVNLIDETYYKKLKENVKEHFFKAVWDGVDKIQGSSKKADLIIAETADALTKVYNTLITASINKLMQNADKLSEAELLKEIDKQVDFIDKHLDTFLEVGEDQDQLNLLKDKKEELNDSIRNILTSFVKTKGDKYLFKQKLGVLNKESISSGIPPLTTHTIDSSNIHRTMWDIRSTIGELLTIHDAIVATPPKLLAGRIINKIFYRNTVGRWNTLDSNVRLLQKALNTLESFKNTDDLQGVFSLDMLNELQSTLNCTMQRSIVESEKLKAKTLERLYRDGKYIVNVNQYAFFDVGNYKPNEDKVTFIDRFDKEQKDASIIEYYKDLILRSTTLSSEVSVNQMAQVLVDKFSNNKLFRDEFLTTKNQMSGTLKWQQNTVGICKSISELQEIIIDRLSKKQDSNKDALIEDVKNAFKEYQTEFAKKINTIYRSIPLENNLAEKSFKDTDLSWDSLNQDTAKGVTSIINLANSTDILDLKRDNSTTLDRAYAVFSESQGLLSQGVNPLTLGLVLVGMSRGYVDREQSRIAYDIIKNLDIVKDLDIFADVSTTISDDIENIWLVNGSQDLSEVSKYVTKENQRKIMSNNSSFAVYSNSTWFNAFVRDIQNKYKDLTNKDTVVLTMSNETDYFTLIALQYLKIQGKYNGGITIASAVSDDNTPADYKGTAISKIMQDKYKDKVIHDFTFSNKKDFNAFGYVSGFDINESFINNGTKANKPKILGTKATTGIHKDNLDKSVLSRVDNLDPGSAKFRLTKVNEYGNQYFQESFNGVTPFSKGWGPQYLDDLDLSTKPFVNREQYKVNPYLRVDNVDVLHAKKQQLRDIVNTYNYTPLEESEKPKRVLDANNADNITNTMVPGATNVFHMTATGEFLDDFIPNIINKGTEESAPLKRLYLAYQRELAKRKAKLYKNQIGLKEFIAPIQVTTGTLDTVGGEISGLFLVSVNNILTGKEYMSGMQFKTAQGIRTETLSEGLTPGSKLDNLVDPNQFVKLRKELSNKFYGIDSQKLDDTFIEIPKAHLRSSYKNVLPINNTSLEETTNIQQGLMNMVYTHEYLRNRDSESVYIWTKDNLDVKNEVDSEDGAVYAQRTLTNSKYKYMSLRNVTNSTSANAIGESVVSNLNGALLNTLGIVSGAIKSPIKAMRRVFGTNGVQGIRSYDLDSIDVTQEIVANRMDKDSISLVIDHLKADDVKNGADNSHLEGIVQDFINSHIKLLTTFAPEIGRNGKFGYREAVDENTGTRYLENYALIGKTIDKGESNLELFIHEGFLHPVMRYLSKDPTAMRQATQIYSYVMRQLKLEHFTTCSTREAERIMTRLKAPKGVEAIEEFMVYATSNGALINAISNIPNKTNVKESLFSRIKGVISRIYYMINKNAVKDGVPQGNMIPVINELYTRLFNMANAEWGNSSFFTTENNGEFSKENFLDKIIRTTDGKVREIFSDTINTELSFDNYQGQLERAEGKEYINKEFDVIPTLFNHLDKCIENKEGMQNAVAEALSKVMNSTFGNELRNSLEGNSVEQWEYLKLNLYMKQAVDIQRQQASVALTKQIDTLLRDVPLKVKNNLVDYFIRTDISSIFNNLGSEQAINLIKNREARLAHIANLERIFRDNPDGNYFINASKGLSDYLTKGINTSGLGYRNAYEIASKSGSSRWALSPKSTDLINRIDTLSTLYAIDYLDSLDSNIYAELSENTLSELSNIHNSIKQMEAEKVFGSYEEASKHVPKGALAGGRTSSRYEILPASKMEAIKWSTPTSIEETRLDPFFKSLGKDFVNVFYRFRSEVPIEGGVFALTDIFQGRTLSGHRVGSERIDEAGVDGRISNSNLRKVTDYLDKRIAYLNRPNATLLDPEQMDGTMVPTFGISGQLNGAQFELNRIKSDLITKRNYKVANVLGDLYGSVIERSVSENTNLIIAEAVDDIYKNATNKDKFTWITDQSTDERIVDFYRKIPREVKRYFNEKYPNKGVPIKTRMLTIALGNRNLTTKQLDEKYYSKTDEEKQLESTVDKACDIINHMFLHGYSSLLEEALTTLTSTAKENIVVKGLECSKNNLISNVFLLNNLGVPFKEIGNSLLEGANFLKDLQDNIDKLENIKAKHIRGKATKAEIKSMEAIRKLIETNPAYPIYKEGGLGTIVDDLSTNSTPIKDLIDKYIPSGVNHIAHTVANDQSSIIYKYTRDFATLGDKLAKYALYKHLTEKKNYSKNEALRQLHTYFINYNIKLPLGLDLLDRIGILSFMKYTLGTQTAILRALMRKPTKSLIHAIALNCISSPISNVYQALLGINKSVNAFGGFSLFTNSLDELVSFKFLNTVA